MHSNKGDRVYAAIDLGASSGRVIAGIVESGSLRLREVHRFETTYVDDGEYRRWDVTATFAESLVGLRAVQEIATSLGVSFSGIGVDTWGVDYGLVSRGAADLKDVRHHRKAGVQADGYDAFETTATERYASTGILDQSINTVQQLAVRVSEGSVPPESTVLFLPDIWIFLLTGDIGTDASIASTSQLLEIGTGQWSARILSELSPVMFNMPPVRMSGSYAGAVTTSIAESIGLVRAVPVYRIAGHDTASAFGFAKPARVGESTTGLVSSGTWSLAGICIEEPIVTDAARTAQFTSERGLRGVLMLRNLNGMWPLQEAARVWTEDDGIELTVPALVRDAADARSHDQVIDMTDDRLLAPGDMPARISALAVEAGRPKPETRRDIARVVLDSLAAAYASSVIDAARLARVDVTAIRIVGGGSRSTLLCQLTADRSGLPVVAGTSEATAIGNVAAQLWASGYVETVEEAYGLLAEDAWTSTTYYPHNPATQTKAGRP